MDPASSFKERINKNYSRPDDEKKYLDWIKSVDSTLGLLRSRQRDTSTYRDASTYRVPSKLRAMKHEAYTPQMVSIGPFHRQKPELQELKWRYMLAFFDRVVISDMENIQADEPLGSKKVEISALYKCSKVISELEEKARAWYAEDINLDKHQLVEMLLVDGCFILELFYRCIMINTQKFEDEFFYGPPEKRVPFESLAGNFTMVQTLRHDLMLLENQIPYFVLQKIFDIISSSKTAFNEIYPNMSLEECVFWFFDSVPMLRFNYLKLFIAQKDRTYNHLLDMLYRVCKATFLHKLPLNYIPNNREFSRCATELFKSGLQIMRGYNSTIVDIKFIDGKIYIPLVIIDKSSDTLFRNLTALEQTRVGRHIVTSYVKLMRTLIRSVEDECLLERLGIIRKSDEVEDVSVFFRSLCREVVFVDFCFTDLCHEVEHYQIPFWRWRRVKGYLSINYTEWKASIHDLKRDYFRNKWSVIASIFCHPSSYCADFLYYSRLLSSITLNSLFGQFLLTSTCSVHLFLLLFII